MELQAARADGLQHRIGRRSEQNQRRAVRWFFQDFQEQVGVVPAHGVRVVQNEDAPAALRLEVRSALHRAQLTHTNHRARDGREAAHRIGDEQPHVRMRFDDQRHALDHRRIG